MTFIKMTDNTFTKFKWKFDWNEILYNDILSN